MFNLSKICRTCMKSNNNLVDLFDQIKLEENNRLQLADILMTITDTQVVKNDGLPQNICDVCVNILQNVVIFRDNVLKCEEELKKIIFFDTTLKEEFEEVGSESDHAVANDEKKEELSLESLVPKDEIKLEDNLYQCNNCSKQYTSYKRFLSHLATHETSLSCSKCNRVFQKKSTFDKHLSKHHDDNKHYAEDEDLNDMINKVDVIHIKKEDLELYTCNACGQSFSKQRSLLSHTRKHSKREMLDIEKRFECDYCAKVFSMKPLLRRHLKLHSIDKPYACSKCPKRYTRQDQFFDHLQRHNGIKGNICSYCNKAFFQLCSLKDHLRTHTKEAPYLCSQCGKSFTNSSNLRQHMMRHTGVKPFACKLCPKTFCTKGQMMCHMTTHTDVHPHKCDECGASFTKLNSLKKHQLIHLGIKPFPCDSCHMRFNSKDHLKRHQRIHTGEKPYRCNYCEKAFAQSNDLAKHIRTHVGQNIYQCSVCNTKFRLKRELQRHYPTHYIKDTETPTVPVGKGIEAPVLLLKTPQELTLEEETSQNTDRQITITVSSNGYKDGLAGGIIINVAPQNS